MRPKSHVKRTAKQTQQHEHQLKQQRVDWSAKDLRNMPSTCEDAEARAGTSVSD
jgi:hypothetical protein